MLERPLEHSEIDSLCTSNPNTNEGGPEYRAPEAALPPLDDNSILYGAYRVHSLNNTMLDRSGKFQSKARVNA